MCWWSEDYKEGTTERVTNNSNFTIPTKIFCRVQESMQETGQREEENTERERAARRGREKQEAERRKEGERRERLEHEKP